MHVLLAGRADGPDFISSAIILSFSCCCDSWGFPSCSIAISRSTCRMGGRHKSAFEAAGGRRHVSRRARLRWRNVQQLARQPADEIDRLVKQPSS